MNCPHSGPSGIPCTDCFARFFDELQWKLRDVAASIARCDHRNRAAFGTGGSVLWCKDCGSLRARDIDGPWATTEGLRYAKEVDDALTSIGLVHEACEDDSDGKNVIPIKPRT